MKTCPQCGEENPDRARYCMACTAPLESDSGAETEVRKTVTIVFSDLAGSTALGERLDSESLREVMSRYFEEMSAILQRHGGTVEKFIGDAVMAVFGLPRVHEDDAVRAVRAALEMRTALSRLNAELEMGWGVTLSNRTGVNTGEVVAGDPTLHQRLVTGDAVNLAARLEQAAPHGEVLIGEMTYRLTKGRVVAEPVEPLTLKGKSQPIRAYKLHEVVAVAGAGTSTGIHTVQGALVGRTGELGTLTKLLDHVSRDRSGHMALVVGSPGVGKSRLVEEFLARLGGATHVLRGRCLSYGEGITFWPLREAVQSLARDGEDIAKVLEERLAGTEDAEEVIGRLESLLGVSDRSHSVEDLLWGFRRLLQTLGRDGAVVLVLDDVQWGEATFLDMVERLRDSNTTEPILILCLARPEIAEVRPAWVHEPGPDGSVLSLEPMGSEDSQELVTTLLGGLPTTGSVLERLVTSAGGNPLFAQELVGMLVDDGLLVRSDDGWVVAGDLSTLAIPPSIHALLAARLDALVPAQRSVLERGSVIGQVFYRGAVKELTPVAVRPHVDDGLEHLEAADYIRPDQAGFDGEDAFRFRHLLIRDAAYEGMLKRTRASLHEAFGGWLQGRVGERSPEYQEILGYHFEQAYQYLSELGPPDEHARSLADTAAEHLLAAGNRARSRGDLPAAANLFTRADALWQRDDRERVVLLIDLSDVMRVLADASWEAVLRRAEQSAAESGDSIAWDYALMARLAEEVLEDQVSEQRVQTEIDRMQSTFEAARDYRGLTRLWNLRRTIAWARLQLGLSEVAFREVIRYGRLAGDERSVFFSLGMLASCAWLGPTPVDDAIRQCEELFAEARDNRMVETDILHTQAALLAMRGQFELAREVYRRALAMTEEMGLTLYVAASGAIASEIEMLAGDPAAAARELQRNISVLIEADDRWNLPTNAGMLAMAFFRKGSLDEALEWCEVCRRTAAELDFDGQSRWRRARALVLATRGEFDEADRLSMQAVELFAQSDYLNEKAQIKMERGEILALAGRTSEAATALAEALEGFEQKGNLVGVARARNALGELTRRPME